MKIDKMSTYAPEGAVVMVNSFLSLFDCSGGLLVAKHVFHAYTPRLCHCRVLRQAHPEKPFPHHAPYGSEPRLNQLEDFRLF